MKRRVLTVSFVILMIFAFVSCRPTYIFVPVERPGTSVPSGSSVSAEDVSRALRDSIDEEFFKSDLEKTVSFTSSRDTLSRMSLSVNAATAKNIYALVSFIDFTADNGVTFIGGSLLFTIHVEEDGTFTFSKYEAKVVCHATFCPDCRVICRM